jgi:hypothetical protein
MITAGKVREMSADWYCRIGEKKVGPLNGHQLKTIVAKGQLRPEHLVRQGSEGPWVPAGRIKGLFPKSPAGTQPQGQKPPPATAKPLPKAAAKPGTPPTAKAASLPSAAEAPAPPAADIPQELTLGGHKHHVEMNVGSLNIDAEPVDVSRRKLKRGMKGLKKEEQKKLTVLLLCFIGGGMGIGVITLIWAFASGQFSGTKPEESKEPIAPAAAADSGKVAKNAEKAEKKPVEDKEPPKDRWPRIKAKSTVGTVEVVVLTPKRGAPPKGAKTNRTDVLIVPVKLYLKQGEKKPVELKNWADEPLVDKVSLRDDQNRKCELLAQVADGDGDGKTISEKWLTVKLIFEPPSDKMKFLHLKLPAAPAALPGDGPPSIYYEIHADDILPEAAKAAKPEEDDSGEDSSKSDKKKSDKAKAADDGAKSH